MATSPMTLLSVENPPVTTSHLFATASCNYIGVLRPHNAIAGTLKLIIPLGVPNHQVNLPLSLSPDADMAYFATASISSNAFSDIRNYSSFGVIEWTYPSGDSCLIDSQCHKNMASNPVKNPNSIYVKNNVAGVTNSVAAGGYEINEVSIPTVSGYKYVGIVGFTSGSLRCIFTYAQVNNSGKILYCLVNTSSGDQTVAPAFDVLYIAEGGLKKTGSATMATYLSQEYYEVLEDAFYKRVLIRTTPIPVQYQDMILGNETGTETRFAF